MPGIATHHIFGIEVYRELSDLISPCGDERANHEAFLLGNQGPDPFFYVRALPGIGALKGIGSRMHRQNTQELLQAVHDCFIATGSAGGVHAGAAERKSAGRAGGVHMGAAEHESAGSAATRDSQPKAHVAEEEYLQAARRAYGLGFLCHYVLDSTVHPLVYAQQDAIGKVGVEGIDERWVGRVVHATIETQIDEYLLTAKLGTMAMETPPHKSMLNCPEAVLFDLSRTWADAIELVFAERPAASLFQSAVWLNRAGQLSLDSFSSGIRRRLDYLKVLGASYPYLKALSHSPHQRKATVFANANHVRWPHPSIEGAVMDKSFDELYDAALHVALEALPAFAAPVLDSNVVSGIVKDTNFHGKPVQL